LSGFVGLLINFPCAGSDSPPLHFVLTVFREALLRQLVLRFCHALRGSFGLAWIFLSNCCLFGRFHGLWGLIFVWALDTMSGVGAVSEFSFLIRVFLSPFSASF